MRYVMKLRHILETPKVRHYWGMPPMDDGADDSRQLMPPALFLLIDENTDGVLLVRHSESGAFCGDTWHESIEDAKHQADYEFGTAVGEWIPVPEEESDCFAFARKRVR